MGGWSVGIYRYVLRKVLCAYNNTDGNYMTLGTLGSNSAKSYLQGASGRLLTASYMN